MVAQPLAQESLDQPDGVREGENWRSELGTSPVMSRSREHRATGGLANLTGASIVANTFSRNGRQGIALAPGTRANRLLDNVTEGNAQYGIRLLPGTQDNLLVRNRMLGNGLADAVDETAVTTDGVTVLANRWVRNTCTVDVPAGKIC